MEQYFRKVGSQILEFARLLSPAKKAAMAITAGGIGVACLIMFLWAGDTTFTPLMQGLSPEDASAVIKVLRDERIPFRVDDSGRNITVPPENLHELRFKLATMGLPQGGTVGYEVFDKQSLGATSFVQRINEKRAREGELMRTISAIKGVRRTRVHLALPQKSAFVEDQKKPTASVIIELEPGVTLNEKQVYGIGNLVAKSIEGMDAADVAVLDAQGKVLSKNNADPLSAQTLGQLEYQQKIEGDLERRIKEMLGRVVGEGRVEAKVTAELDFSQVSETATTYDADGSAVRTVDKRNDNMTMARGLASGAAGAAANQAGDGANPNGTKSDTTKVNEVTSYEVPQTVRRTQRAAGGIKKLSVAVVVDGKTVKSTDKDGVVLAKIEAWPPEKLKEFEGLVASALGVDRKRGDVLEIKNLEFQKTDFEEAEKMIADGDRKTYLRHLIIYGVIGLTILLFFLFVVRPFIKWVTENTIDSVDTFLPQTIEELERIQKNSALPTMEEVVPVMPDKIDPEKVEGEMIKEKIITMVESNPHKAALILKDWLHVQKAAVPGAAKEGTG